MGLVDGTIDKTEQAGEKLMTKIGKDIPGVVDQLVAVLDDNVIRIKGTFDVSIGIEPKQPAL